MFQGFQRVKKETCGMEWVKGNQEQYKLHIITHLPIFIITHYEIETYIKRSCLHMFHIIVS